MNSGQRYRILLVEDDRVDQFAFERFVREQSLPYDYIVAGSVAEARMLLGAERFDLVVSDFNIGDGDAFEVIRLAKSLPVVVITGSGDEVVAVKALKAGAADYLIKDHERNYLRILPTTIENAYRRARIVEQVMKLTHAVEQSPVSVMVTDSKGHIEYVNARFLAVTGLAPQEVIGQNPRILKSGEHTTDFYRDLWHTVSSGKVWRGELHNRKKDGSLFWESASISPVVNQDGTITHYVAVKEDVTDRKQAAAALRESEESFRALAENARDGIMIATAETGHVFVNRRAEEITGYTADEWQYRSFWEIAGPDERARLQAIFRRRLEGGPAAERYEATITHKDGIPVPVELSLGRTAWRGHAAVIRIVRDITERRRAEAMLADRERRLAVLIQQMPAVLWTTDTTLRFTSSVGAGLAQLGLKPGQVVGMSLYEYFDSQDPAHPPLAAHLAALKGEHCQYVFETQGKSYDCEVQPLFDVLGNVVGTIGVAQDITALREAERAREKLIAELDAFSHTVAHDLKGPVGTVIGFAELLAEKGRVMSEKDTRESLDALRQCGHKMNTIIEELLVLAGVRKGEFQPEPLDMARIVNDARQELYHMAQEFQPEVVLPESWPTAIGHGPWVEEIWTNYLSNGMKYGGRPPRLELGGELVGDRVRFWVKDNGPGLTEEQQACLFAPFTQLHQVRTSGQGLGLSIVHRIMERLGGEVWVESQPGHGSRFGFTLPRAPA